MAEVQTMKISSNNRIAIVALVAVLFAPAAAFARPVHAGGRIGASVVRDRSPHVQTHESILPHS